MIPNLDSIVDSEAGTFKLDLSNGVTEKKATAEYLSGKTITVTLDGKSKTINLPDVKAVAGDQDGTQTAKNFADALNDELKSAFGTDSSGKSRVSVTLDGGALSFTTDKGSTLSVTTSNADVGDVLGIGSGLTTYLDTTKTLGELNVNWNSLTGTAIKGTGAITQKKDENGDLVVDDAGKPVYVDADGNTVDENGNRLDEDGNIMYQYDLEINGVKIGTYTKDTEMNTIINNINSNTEAGVSVSYSKTTGQFVFTAKDTGAGGRVEIASGGLGAELFGATLDSQGALRTDLGDDYSKGQDAKINATINGETMELTRSSNTFDLDGMNIGQAAMFCDIGLLGIPDSVIEQGPNQSGPDQEIYYQHTVLGHALFSTGMTDGRHLADHAAEIAYWHHKRYDGGGFPADDPPGSIPLSAQLTHTALLLLEYADYFEDHADPIQRALRALAGDVGHAISQEMYTSAHSACAALSALLPFQK